MKHQALFSSKGKSKKIKCRLLQFLFGALMVNTLKAIHFVSVFYMTIKLVFSFILFPYSFSLYDVVEQKSNRITTPELISDDMFIIRIRKMKKKSFFFLFDVVDRNVILIL